MRISNATSSGLTLVDLELLHHFTTTTCFTFSLNPHVQTLWRIDAPQVGLCHEFVLHGILAIAGLHLARLNPTIRDFYVGHAIVHYQTASSMAMPLISDISHRDSSSLFLFSVLTVYLALASSPPSDQQLLGEAASIPTWLFLMQGTRTILQHRADAIKSGTFGSMIIGHPEVKLWNATPSRNQGLQSLRSLIDKMVITKHLEATKAEVCYESLDQLAKAFTIGQDQAGSSDYVRQVLIWTMIVPDAYMTLVRDQVPEALCNLGYYCVLLKKLEYMWLFEGWSRYLISNIYYLLNDMYRTYIVWPMQEIGWIP
jgi:hypothetical protein